MEATTWWSSSFNRSRTTSQVAILYSSRSLYSALQTSVVERWPNLFLGTFQECSFPSKQSEKLIEIFQGQTIPLGHRLLGFSMGPNSAFNYPFTSKGNKFSHNGSLILLYGWRLSAGLHTAHTLGHPSIHFTMFDSYIPWFMGIFY